MTRALGLLARALASGVVVAQLGGLAVLVLAMAVEGADEPRLGAMLWARVPETWARCASALSLLGAALAAFRLRRQGAVLGLGACGVSPVVFVVVGALVGAGAGGAAATIRSGEDVAVPGAWERGEGGWWRDGRAFADVAGGVVGAPERRDEGPAAAVTGGAAAGALGVTLGLFGGRLGTLLAAATFLVAEALALGLCERGALPTWAMGGPAAAAALATAWVFYRAPLFPRRWG